MVEEAIKKLKFEHEDTLVKAEDQAGMKQQMLLQNRFVALRTSFIRPVITLA